MGVLVSRARVRERVINAFWRTLSLSLGLCVCASALSLLNKLQFVCLPSARACQTPHRSRLRVLPSLLLAWRQQMAA